MEANQSASNSEQLEKHGFAMVPGVLPPETVDDLVVSIEHALKKAVPAVQPTAPVTKPNPLNSTGKQVVGDEGFEPPTNSV